MDDRKTQPVRREPQTGPRRRTPLQEGVKKAWKPSQSDPPVSDTKPAPQVPPPPQPKDSPDPKG